jgi:hypothetical protein
MLASGDHDAPRLGPVDGQELAVFAAGLDWARRATFAGMSGGLLRTATALLRHLVMLGRLAGGTRLRRALGPAAALTFAGMATAVPLAAARLRDLSAAAFAMTSARSATATLSTAVLATLPTAAARTTLCIRKGRRSHDQHRRTGEKHQLAH